VESAIDQHLTCPRTLSRRVPGDYQPPFPMWVGRADPSVQQVVMAYLGVQFRTDDQRPAALDALRTLVIVGGHDNIALIVNCHPQTGMMRDAER
jgi:aldoxime dehydratase